MTKYALLAVLLLGLAQGSTAGTNIEVEHVGTGRDLVFIPALGCPGAEWDEVVADLSKDFACHVVSLPGHGAPCPDGPGDADALLAEIAALGKAAGGKPVLIGHSYGGFLALHVAAAYPEAFARLIIVDAQPFPIGFLLPDATVDQARQQAGAVRNMMMQLSTEQFKNQSETMLKDAVADTARLRELVQWRMQSDREVLADAFYELLSSDLREDLQTIAAPTLVLGTWVAGESMGLTQAKAQERFEQQYARVADCTIHISDKARHFVMYDDPAWLIQAIREFIE